MLIQLAKSGREHDLPKARMAQSGRHADSNFFDGAKKAAKRERERPSSFTENFDDRLNQTEACVTATPIGHEPDPDKAKDHHSPSGRLGHRPDIAGYIHSNLFDGA